MSCLIVADPGPLLTALEAHLSHHAVPYRVAASNDDDLFGCALGCRAVIYVAAPNQLVAKVEPAADRERLLRVLAATSAPGVEVIVAALPEHDAYLCEFETLRRHGKPFVALRVPALVEEVAASLPERASLWLPSRGCTAVGRAKAVAQAVALAVDTEEQGRLTGAPSELANPVTLMREAAALRGGGVRVRSVAAWVYRLLRGVARWFGAQEPGALRLAEALYPELAPRGAQRLRALPAASAG
jgi:hypothetical protein